jgi:hypothetical protein
MSWSHGGWPTLSTVTTVGYGYLYPVTNAGRAAALLLMLAGIALVGIITAAVAAWFVRSVLRAAEPTEPEPVSVQPGLLRRLDLLDARVADVDAGVQQSFGFFGPGTMDHPGPSTPKHGRARANWTWSLVPLT